jgi:flavin-dependent dehydrogenase
MPLVLFPGGYGGLVASDGGRTSFSCCVRRDALRRCRARAPGLAAGEALLRHAMSHCQGLAETLGEARREGPWLSAGPIRPGIRRLSAVRRFAIGNAAGEAHPLVAEGISMAIQSAWLMGNALARTGTLSDADVDEAGVRYAATWRENFALRVRASSAFARLLLSPGAAAAGERLTARIPALLTHAAALAGKAHTLRPLEASP